MATDRFSLRPAGTGASAASASAASADLLASAPPFAGRGEGQSLSRHLLSLLPAAAFRTDRGRLGLLLINAAILALGWTMARQLDQWS